MHLKWWLREQEKLINRSILIESAIFEFGNDTDTVHGIVHHVFHEEECIVIEMNWNEKGMQVKRRLYYTRTEASFSFYKIFAILMQMWICF